MEMSLPVKLVSVLVNSGRFYLKIGTIKYKEGKNNFKTSTLLEIH